MSVDWSYFDRFEKIENKYLPDTGEGDTKATQLVTAVTKLVYKYYNDGDTYDNTYLYWYEGYNDLSSYANWIYKNYRDLGDILMHVKTSGFSESEYEDLLKLLCIKVFRESFLSAEDEKSAVGSIYSAKGPFRVEEEEYYDDDEDDDYYDEDDYDEDDD